MNNTCKAKASNPEPMNPPLSRSPVYASAPDPDYSDPVSDIHLMDYVHIVLQRLPLAILIFAAISGLGTAYTLTRSPRYSAKATLLIDPGQVNLTDIKGALDPVSAAVGRREFIQTQVELIKSRPVAETVIQRMDLLATPEFRKVNDPVAWLQRFIRATPGRNTHLIEVSIEREDRVQAQRLVNTLIQAFIDDVRRRRLGVSEEGLEQLRLREQTLRERLDSASAALQQFMIENDMVSFERSQNVIMNRLIDLTRQLTAMQPRRMALQARVESAQTAMESGESITVLPDVIDAPIIRTLKLELSKLSNEYSQLVERLGDNHPNLQAKTTQLQTLQTKMLIEASAILTSLRMQYEQALVEEELLNQAIKQQEQEVYRFNRLAAEYETLRRIKDAIEGPYITISRRIEEIDINRIGGQGENIFIIAKASLPAAPSWPSKKNNLLITIILAGALAVGICFFLDYMDTTIKNESDVRRLLHSKILAGIPNIAQKGETKGQADLVAFENPRSHTAEAFRTLRTAIAFSIPGERISSVVVTSSLPSEGKSLSAVSIAIIHAQSGKRTLLVDSDMRKPRLHRVFNIKPASGLSSILSGEIQLEDAVQATGIPDLALLPCGPVPKNPAELLDSEKFVKMLSCMHDHYDFIVFDSPPGFALVDSLIIGKYTDGVILVVKSFETPKAAAAQFTSRLYEANVRLLGVVLNTMAAPRTGYYYGGYYHGKGGKYAKYYRDGDNADA